jgi:cytoskeletal protein CcmA (bactofilin family)
MGRWKRFRAPKIATVIGKGTCIEGDLSFSGGLHLDGRVKGNLSADDGDERAVLVVSDMGLVEGDVRVPNVILNGKVIGDLFSSERVELASNARVTGTLHYKLMEMAIGAEVNGQLVYSESKEPRMLDYQGGEGGPPEGGDGSR